MFEWAIHLGFIKANRNPKRETTNLFNYLSDSGFLDDDVLLYELAYIELVNNHALADLFINHIAGKIVNRYPNLITRNEVREQVIVLSTDYPELDTTQSQLREGANLLLNTLTNYEGFGPLEILVETGNDKEKSYKIKQYKPLLGTFIYSL